MWRISRIKNSIRDNQKVYLVTAVSFNLKDKFLLAVHILLLSILKLRLINCERLTFLSTICTDPGWLTLIMRLLLF
jgi:hypothetical protein